MALGSFFSVAAAALLATWPYLSDAGFLGLLFAVVALQTRGPRAVATGILSVMSSYLALGLGYSFPIFPALSTFCVTILFGLAYSLAGAQVGTVLTLRLEETGIGVASALISGLLVFPRPTREHVHEMGRNLLVALAGVVRTSAQRLAGDTAALPLEKMRQADRMLRDLRAALRPLQASRARPFAPVSTELAAVILCMFWVRHLATMSEASAPDDEGEAIVERVFRPASKFDNLTVDDPAAEGPTAKRANFSAPKEVSLSIEHLGAPTKAALDVTLDNLEAALSLLAARLRTDGWSALVWRRRL